MTGSEISDTWDEGVRKFRNFRHLVWGIRKFRYSANMMGSEISDTWDEGVRKFRHLENFKHLVWGIRKFR